MARPLRPNYSFILLILMVLGSAWQYYDRGQVTWMTNSIRWVDNYSRSLLNKSTTSITTAQPHYDLVGNVTRVKDGDTIVIKDSRGTEHSIRLHGIDTPEHDQPHGKKASKAMSDWVAGETVAISTKDTDSDGRTVGVVYVGGVNLNLEMVCAGHAWWYRQYAQFDFELRACEQKAKERGDGLWAEANPVPPWEWRSRDGTRSANK